MGTSSLTGPAQSVPKLDTAPCQPESRHQPVHYHVPGQRAPYFWDTTPRRTFYLVDAWERGRHTESDRRTFSPFLLSSPRPQDLIGLPGLAACVGFVGFDDASRHRGLIGRHAGADTLEHVPCRFLVQFQITGELRTGQAFRRVDDQRDSGEPLWQGNVRALKDRSGQDVERGFAIMAIPASDTDFQVGSADVHRTAA